MHADAPRVFVNMHDAFPLIAIATMENDRWSVRLIHRWVLAQLQGTVEEGDIFFTNDPYKAEGAISHANDWLIVLPIFYNGRLVGWSCHFGHMTDNGGKGAGLHADRCHDHFEEGLVTPPTKLYKKGVLQATLSVNSC